MAWASKKQYAILMNSEEGKDLAEQLPDLDQDDFQVKFGELLGKTGASYDWNDDDDREPTKEERESYENYDNWLKDEAKKGDKKENEEDDDEERQVREQIEGDTLFGNDEPPAGNDFDEYYNKAKEFDNYEKLKAHYDYIKKIHGDGSVPEKATKKALDEMSKNFDKGENDIDDEELSAEDIEGNEHTIMYELEDIDIENEDDWDTAMDLSYKLSRWKNEGKVSEKNFDKLDKMIKDKLHQFEEKYDEGNDYSTQAGYLNTKQILSERLDEFLKEIDKADKTQPGLKSSIIEIITKMRKGK